MKHNRNFLFNTYLKPNSFWSIVLHKTDHFITNTDNVLLNKSMYSTKNFLKWDTIVDLLHQWLSFNLYSYKMQSKIMFNKEAQIPFLLNL